MPNLILVIGATGTIGLEVVRLLVDGGLSVRALTRNPTRASKFPPSVDVAVGDLHDPRGLKPAFLGVDKVFLVTSDPTLEPAAIDAASKASVKLIVKSSALGPGGTAPPAHKAAEDALRHAESEWVILRPNAFMQTLSTYLPTLLSPDGTFSLPAGAGRTSWIDARDIAAVGAALLAASTPETGVTHVLTGPAALSMHDVAADLSAVVGRPIRYQPMEPDNARTRLRQRGLPDGMADFLATHYTAVRAGDFENLTDDVMRLTGQPARSWSTFLEDCRAAVEAFR
jgi:uncharacterized protein YbjT (DUF2867 family)